MLLQDFVSGGVVTWIFVSFSRWFKFKRWIKHQEQCLSQLQTPRTSRNFYRCKPLKCMLDYVFGRSCVRFLSGPQILSSSVSCRSHHFTHFICELELKIYHHYLLSVDCIKRVERAVSYHIKLWVRNCLKNKPTWHSFYGHCFCLTTYGS